MDDERATDPSLDEGIAFLKEARSIFARLYANDPERMAYLKVVVEITNLLQQGGPSA